MCPLDRTRCRKMSHSGFGSIIWSLWLRDVDNSSGHTADEDHGASTALSLHQVLRYTRGKEVCSVDVDTPKFLHSFVWVGNGIVVLGEPGGCDEVVDLPVDTDYVFERGFDGCWVGDITVVSCYVGNAEDAVFLCGCEFAAVVGLAVWVVLFELFD